MICLFLRSQYIVLTQVGTARIKLETAYLNTKLAYWRAVSSINATNSAWVLED